jgi:hypothetical protein
VATTGIGLLGAPAQAGSSSGTPNDVLAWNGIATDAAVAACIAPLDNPLHESRMLAMMHIAIHDALNAIHRRSVPYAYAAHSPADASASAAVAAAAHDVLVPAINQIPAPFPQSCRDAGAALVQTAYARALAAVPDTAGKAHGITVGQASAQAILTRRSADGSDTLLIDTGYPQGTAPGQYRFTPGAAFAFAPGWGRVTPFGLADANQYRPAPPPALTSSRYTKDFREIQRLGGDGITTPTQRTAQQTEIALFWWESSPQAWNRITRDIATERHLDDWDSARLFGLLNLALADGYIGSFATKYHDAFWRPVTAIQNADTDGNRKTHADPTWTPLRPTPAIPDYDSAHAVEGGAAAAVLRRFFRTDRISFRACSRTLPAGGTCSDPTPVQHHFSRLSQAAEENGLSRIYIGFHFRTAVEAGIDHGRRIGDHTVANYLRPSR